MHKPPHDRFIEANRLRHHLLEWGDGTSLVLLLHGFLEHAHAWHLIGPALAAAGYHVFALDWRGHGDSEWVGSGGDRKSTRLNSSHVRSSYAVFCLKKKK